MIDPLGSVQPQAASSAASSTQRIDTATGDQAQPRSDLNQAQAAVEIGGSVPIVFGLRGADTGGVWVNPPASEARILNDLENNVSIWYELVISDGEIGPIVDADVFQGDQRRGSVEFSYGARAGDWEPGSFVQQRWQTISSTEINEITSGPEQTLELAVRSNGSHVTYFKVTHENVSPGTGLTALDNYTATAQVSMLGYRPEPVFTEYGDLAGKAAGDLTQYFRQTIEEIDRPPYDKPATFSYCGDGTGSYDGMSVLSFSDVYPDGDDGYLRAVHVFVREGIKVPRLIEGSVGSSDLFPDLAAYLLRARLSEELIDVALLEESARFCRAQAFAYNGAIGAPTNIRDFLNRIAPLNLLTVTQIEGRLGLRPAVPYNGDYAIYAGPTVARCKFDESNIVEGTFEVEYVQASDRRPFAAEMTWRQQPEGNVGLIRTTQVRFADTPDDAPLEQYDLSEFCTNHVHAAKVGAYVVSRRRHVTHTARLKAQPGGYAGVLAPGDVVEVSLTRESSVDVEPPEDFRHYYQVNSISTDRQGNVELELTHWPVDDQGRSLIALDVGNVDPGSVSDDGTGLPQPVSPGDPLLSEEFYDNFYTTLRFLDPIQLDGFIRFCVEASKPIRNGDLTIYLNIGYAIVIREGQTVGCVDVPIILIDPDTPFLDIPLPDFDFDDIVIEPILIDPFPDSDFDFDPDFDFDLDLDPVLLDPSLDPNLDLDPVLLDPSLDPNLDPGLLDPNLQPPDLSGSIDPNLRLNINFGDFYDDPNSNREPGEEPCYAPGVGVYFDSLEFNGAVLIVRIRIDPSIPPYEVKNFVDGEIALFRSFDPGDDGALGLIDLNGSDDTTTVNVVCQDAVLFYCDVIVTLTTGHQLTISAQQLSGSVDIPGYWPNVDVASVAVPPTHGIAKFGSIANSVYDLAINRLGGPLALTIKSTEIARVWDGSTEITGQEGVPNPPTFEATGTIVQPWPSDTPIPSGMGFVGELRIGFETSAFPPEGLRFEVPITFVPLENLDNVGYCGVQYLNGALAVFEPIGRIAFFTVSNVNAAADDNVQVSVNGVSVGRTLSFTADERTSYVFSWGASGQECLQATGYEGLVLAGETLLTGGAPGPGETIVVTLTKVTANNNGNYGLIHFGFVGGSGSGSGVQSIVHGGEGRYELTFPSQSEQTEGGGNP